MNSPDEYTIFLKRLRRLRGALRSSEAFCALRRGGMWVCSGLILGLGVFNYCISQTEISGEVSGVWTSEDSPYIVVDSTWVPEGEELTIEAGVTVLFYPNIGLDVFGGMSAEGSEEDSVFFLPHQNDTIWRGITLHPVNARFEFQYCSFKDVYSCLIINSGQVISITGCLAFPEDYAIKIEQNGWFRRITVNNSVLYRNFIYALSGEFVVNDSYLYGGIDIYSGSVTLYRCTFFGGIRVPYTSFRDCSFFEDYYRDFGPFIYIDYHCTEFNGCYVSDEVSINWRDVSDIILLNSRIDGKLGIEAKSSVSLIDCIFDKSVIIRNELDTLIINNCVFGGHLSCLTDSTVSITIDSCNFAEYVMIYVRTDIDILFTRNVFKSKSYIQLRNPSLQASLSMKFLNNTVVADLRSIHPGHSIPYGFFELILSDNNSYYFNINNNIFYSISDSASLIHKSGRYPNDALISDTHFSYNCLYNFSKTYRLWPDTSQFVPDSTNLITDPEFVSVVQGNLHLDRDSPCIDTGDPDSELDPDATRPDMGKYYRHHNLWITDFNRNHNWVAHDDSLIAFPNPFNNNLSISYTLPRPIHTVLRLFDIVGREVALLGEGNLAAGSHTLTYNGIALPSGVYLLNLETPHSSSSQKVILMR